MDLQISLSTWLICFTCLIVALNLIFLLSCGPVLSQWIKKIGAWWLVHLIKTTSSVEQLISRTKDRIWNDRKTLWIFNEPPVGWWLCKSHNSKKIRSRWIVLGEKIIKISLSNGYDRVRRKINKPEISNNRSRIYFNDFAGEVW